jgi:hypothetical protein
VLTEQLWIGYQLPMEQYSSAGSADMITVGISQALRVFYHLVSFDMSEARTISCLGFNRA